MITSLEYSSVRNNETNKNQDCSGLRSTTSWFDSTNTASSRGTQNVHRVSPTIPIRQDWYVSWGGQINLRNILRDSWF